MAPGNGPHAQSLPVQAPFAASATEGPPVASSPRPGQARLSGSQTGASSASSATELRDFFKQREGSALRAWLRHFDVNNDQKITLTEFNRGLRAMGFAGDIPAAFASLDHDQSGELSLEEIDMAQASLWKKFCDWCVAGFDGPTDFLHRLHGFNGAVATPRRRDVEVDAADFKSGMQKAGWTHGFEDVIFSSVDTDRNGFICAANLKWLEIEKRRQRRKEEARRVASQDHAKRRLQQVGAETQLASFKLFLRQKYGNYIRAWRRCISQEGNMTVQKNDVFKACAAIGWPGDVRLLWKAFDKDDSGYVSIEELDVKSAEILAQFRVFVAQKFETASAAFRAMDHHNRKQLRQPEFLEAVKQAGFKYPAKLLFQCLDAEGKKAIVEEDLYFLDKWKPPTFLLATVNTQAMDEVKASLLRNYGSYLKAWKHVLDVDSSNRVNWDEFFVACKKLRYSGDIAGAWRALDEDLSGYITLREIDPKASDTLLSFKTWCDEEFGGVRSAFEVFDTDRGGEVSYREFRRACRVYGYAREVTSLFHALESGGNGNLSLNEVAFLDDWASVDDGVIPMDTENSILAMTDRHSQGGRPVELVQYSSDGPGPAHYVNTMPQMGQAPMAPHARFQGAYTFRRRLAAQKGLPSLPKDAAFTPSPCTYNGVHGLAAVLPSKPSWQFPTEKRKANEAQAPESEEPGPGHYAVRKPAAAQAAMCMPRRPLRAHPLFRGSFEPSPPPGPPPAPHHRRCPLPLALAGGAPAGIPTPWTSG